MNIGYVGLGALGRELALCFHSSYRLRVWDLNPVARAQCKAAGLEVCESPVDLARHSDVVLLCLPRSVDVRQAVLGPGGLAEGLSPGKMVIDQTSGTPGETSRIAYELGALGVAMLDAAVSANPQVVRTGGATLMVGGSDAMVERALPVLQAITSTVRRCGPRVGDGQAMKLVNNAVYAAARLGTLEVAILARQAGFSLEAVHAAWRDGIACSQATEKMIPALLRGEASTNFALSLMLKDLNQAVAFGLAHDAPMPVSVLTRSLLQMGLNMLGEQARLEDMNGVMESLAGSRLSSDGGASVEPDPGLLAVLEKAVAAICLLATVECVRAGLKYGLELRAMREVLACSSGRSLAGEVWMHALVEESPFRGESLRTWADAQSVALSLAMQHGTPAVLSGCVHDAFTRSLAVLGPQADFAGLTKLHAETAGIRLELQ